MTDNDNPSKVEYPTLQLRVKAVCIDSIVIVLLMKGFTDLFSFLDDVPDSYRITAFVLAVIIYEPLCVRFFGATIGHYFSGIKVKRQDKSNKNITLTAALLRYVIKLALVWMSFLSMSGNDKKQTIHDMMAKSVVVYD